MPVDNHVEKHEAESGANPCLRLSSEITTWNAKGTDAVHPQVRESVYGSDGSVDIPSLHEPSPELSLHQCSESKLFSLNLHRFSRIYPQAAILGKMVGTDLPSSSPQALLQQHSFSLSFLLEGHLTKRGVMSDLLITLYPFLKAFHVMAVISWMAGLFYLPRLFVYHAERRAAGDEPVASFEIMEQKLLRLIMTPAMIATWISGLCLVMTPGIVAWSLIWPWTKAGAVLAMTGFHLWCARECGHLRAGRAQPGRRYRMMNEVPTLLMAVIVLSVIVKF